MEEQQQNKRWDFREDGAVVMVEEGSHLVIPKKNVSFLGNPKMQPPVG